MPLPSFNTKIPEFNLMQTAWAKEINPILRSPIANGILLDKVTLTTGDNTIPHFLGRKLQGWIIVRQRGAASFYDKQDSNTLQDKNLILNASTGVTVDIWVF